MRKCELCDAEATVHITEADVCGDDKRIKKRHLCEECARDAGLFEKSEWPENELDSLIGPKLKELQKSIWMMDRRPTLDDWGKLRRWTVEPFFDRSRTALERTNRRVRATPGQAGGLHC